MFTEDRVYLAGVSVVSASSSAFWPLLHYFSASAPPPAPSLLPLGPASTTVGLEETLSSSAGTLPFLPHLHMAQESVLV